MNTISTNTIEKILSTYKETVSPSQGMLINILNQIPEKESNRTRRAIRSPYMWLAITQYTALCLMLLIVSPTITVFTSNENSFATIDREVDAFEAGINREDAYNMLVNYNNL